MFTGIISDIGTIKTVDLSSGQDAIFDVCHHYQPDSISLGASIAHNGICLTVVKMGVSERGAYYRIAASAETLAKTTMASWKRDDTINLERALKLGDELGGHIVSGHVDGVAELVSLKPENDSVRLSFRPPLQLIKFIATKGSVCVDGVSLTVNEVDNQQFDVNIIEYTQNHTTLGDLKMGDLVNIEIDMLARYVARLAEF